jgi:hypothetical protein
MHRHLSIKVRVGQMTVELRPYPRAVLGLLVGVSSVARSFWIRAKQYTPGPISCGVCGQDFQLQDTASNRAGSHAGSSMHAQVA